MMRRKHHLILFILCAVVGGLSGCGDASISEPINDRPALRVPLQVYPEQTFFLDATRSRRSQGEIKGFIFNPGDGAGDIYTREPLVAYNYVALGDYTVSVRLFDGASREQATISVVSCDQYLACAPPLRPCPAGYVCNDQSLCAPEQPTCLTRADCPFPLECREGACGPGGPCASWPGPRPNPSADATLDADPDVISADTNNPTTCEVHEDCAESAFCVQGQCVDAVCADDCVGTRLESTELLRVFVDHRITGLAYLPGYSPDPFMMSLTGRIWRRSTTYSDGMFGIQEINRPEALLPKFIGTVDMNSVESALNDVSPRWPYWLGLDLTPDLENSEQFGEAWALNFSPLAEGFPIPNPDLLERALLVSQIGRGLIGSSDFEWFVTNDAVSNSYIDSRTLAKVEYSPSAGEVRLVVDGSVRLAAPYVVQSGATICAVATDGRFAFLAENRVWSDASGVPQLGAARIVQLDLEQNAVIDIWPSIVGATCTLELGLDPGTLLSVQYVEDKVPFLATYRYAP